MYLFELGGESKPRLVFWALPSEPIMEGLGKWLAIKGHSSNLIYFFWAQKYMIKKIKGDYRVVAESGRNMGTYKTEAEAKKRLQQIEYFKHRKA
jgi:hypothetical protein